MDDRMSTRKLVGIRYRLKQGLIKLTTGRALHRLILFVPLIMGFFMGGQSIAAIVTGMLILPVLLGLCYAKNLPANFVFGDSLADAGNNDYIVTLAKANFYPYGIDFGQPTGRFTNGRTAIDIIGQELGLTNFTPPYLAPTTTGPVILQGVNYASGGAGILNTTLEIFGGQINLDAQIGNFENTRQDIISMIGAPGAQKLLRTALFSVIIGSNDLLRNNLARLNSTLLQKLGYPEMFVDTVISKYRLQLTRLYNSGARKIVVTNVGPIGCTPSQRESNPTAGNNCVSSSNQLAQLFNTELKRLISDLSTNLQESKFVYGDVYYIAEDIMRNSISYGLDNTNSACCHLAGRFGGLVPCTPVSKVCSDRSKYVFWDTFHPSQAMNAIVARRLLDGDSKDIAPMNIRQLVEL